MQLKECPPIFCLQNIRRKKIHRLFKPEKKILILSFGDGEQFLTTISHRLSGYIAQKFQKYSAVGLSVWEPKINHALTLIHVKSNR